MVKGENQDSAQRPNYGCKAVQEPRMVTPRLDFPPLTRSLLTHSRHRKSTIQRTHAKDWRLPQCAVPHIYLTPLQLSGRGRLFRLDQRQQNRANRTPACHTSSMCELLRRTGHEIGTKLRLLITPPNTSTLHTIHLQYANPEDTTNHLHARTCTLLRPLPPTQTHTATGTQPPHLRHDRLDVAAIGRSWISRKRPRPTPTCTPPQCFHPPLPINYRNPPTPTSPPSDALS